MKDVTGALGKFFGDPYYLLQVGGLQVYSYIKPQRSTKF